MWDVLDPWPDDVALTLVGRDARRRAGLRVHRSTTLRRGDIRLRHHLPVTSPERTMIDMAADASDGELERAAAAMIRRRLTTTRGLAAAVAGAGNARGIARLRRILDATPAFTRSEAERRLLTLVRSAALPLPLVNHRVLGLEVDCYWPRQRLVVEIDGYAFHADRTAFDRDRRRDQTLTAAGYRVIRITWTQLQHEPYAVIARLAQALVAA